MSPATGRFAVVLNRNAKKVTEKVEELSGELVAPDDLFLSTSAEHSEEIARTLVERGYETVFAGGGDGTVMHIINQLAHYPLEQQPVIGILKLGTGNAMARMVSSGNLKGDLKTYIRSATRETIPISLVETEGIRCPFAGVGIDAEILNDYRFAKDNWGAGGVLNPVMQSVGGYFFAFFARTVPRRAAQVILRNSPIAQVTVKNGICHRLGRDGELLDEFGAGDLIYEGPLTIALAGTVPFYGYGMKVLPFATNDPERMHLRVSNIGTGHALAVLPGIWRGEVPSDKIHDFLAEEVEITLDKEVPFQIGGDASGSRRSVTFKTIPNCVRLLRLL
jgi:diacylglycerol kinase family enzyme